VNLLCDAALVYGFAEQIRKIDVGIVNDAAADREARGRVRPAGKDHSAAFRVLTQAIKQRRRVSIRYRDQSHARIVEPHAIYTDEHGHLIADCYQIRGYSSGRRPTPFWRLFWIIKIADPELLDEPFAPRILEGFSSGKPRYHSGLVAVVKEEAAPAAEHRDPGAVLPKEGP
ncbi:MAG: WYL domain-containing protein, partial [Acidiferrobacteraceae bacterium]